MNAAALATFGFRLQKGKEMQLQETERCEPVGAADAEAHLVCLLSTDDEEDHGGGDGGKQHDSDDDDFI